MSILDKLERKFSKFCIPHLLAFLLLGQVAVYLMQGAGMVDVMDQILYGSQVLRGEWYRIFTFLIIPLDQGLFFFLLGIYVTWFIGSTLEKEWGEFRFNVYVLTGWLLSVVASLIFPTIPFHNLYIYMSLTLAFATMFPNFEFLLFFILPVKVKWLGLVMWLGLALSFMDVMNRPMIVASLASYFLFFSASIVEGIRSLFRKKKFQKESADYEERAFHTCSVCGRTDRTDPKREFRYKGGVCFCSAYLEQGRCDAPAS